MSATYYEFENAFILALDESSPGEIKEALRRMIARSRDANFPRRLFNELVAASATKSGLGLNLAPVKIDIED